MQRQADANGNQQIDYYEFMATWLNVPGLLMQHLGLQRITQDQAAIEAYDFIVILCTGNYTYVARFPVAGFWYLLHLRPWSNQTKRKSGITSIP